MSTEIPCAHDTTDCIENGEEICIECGEVLHTHVSLPQMCDQFSTHYHVRARRQTKRIPSIYKDIEGMGFPSTVVKHANHIFQDVICAMKNEKIKQREKLREVHRQLGLPSSDDAEGPVTVIFSGNTRKGFVFACLYSAYKLIGEPQEIKSMIKDFGIDTITAFKGLKCVNTYAQKSSLTFVSPIQHIVEVMDKLKASPEQKKAATDFFASKGPLPVEVTQCRPRTIAAAMVYYWLTHIHETKITLKEFAKVTQMGVQTINKITDEIIKWVKGPSSIPSGLWP